MTQRLLVATRSVHKLRELRELLSLDRGVLAAAQRYPDRFAVMGRISLEAPGSRAEFLPRNCQ